MNLQNIAQLASEIKKPSKSEAFEIIKSLEFDEHNIARLYAFFCDYPESGRKISDLAWVKKAHSKSPRFPYLQVVGGVLLGTCGKVMHCADTDMTEGHYDIAGVKINTEYRGIHEKFISGIKTDFRESVNLTMPRDIKTVTGLDTYVINSSFGIYVSQFKKSMVGFTSPDIRFSENNSRVLIKEGKRTALIMCVRL